MLLEHSRIDGWNSTNSTYEAACHTLTVNRVDRPEPAFLTVHHETVAIANRAWTNTGEI
jgi:hypothetical protein